MVRGRSAAAMVLLVAGCSGPGLARRAPPRDAVAADDAGPVTCERRAPTGSHIPRMLCRPDRAAEGRRLATQDALLRPHPGTLDDFDLVVTRVYGF